MWSTFSPAEIRLKNTSTLAFAQAFCEQTDTLDSNVVYSPNVFWIDSHFADWVSNKAENREVDEAWSKFSSSLGDSELHNH